MALPSVCSFSTSLISVTTSPDSYGGGCASYPPSPSGDNDPHAPPPGVSTQSISPGFSVISTLAANCFPLSVFFPGRPAAPPAIPQGASLLLSVSSVALAGLRNSYSLTSPSPPANLPLPPLP